MKWKKGNKDITKGFNVEKKRKGKGNKDNTKGFEVEKKRKGNKDKKWGRVERGRFLHAGIEMTTVNEPNGTLKVEL